MLKKDRNTHLLHLWNKGLPPRSPLPDDCQSAGVGLRKRRNGLRFTKGEILRAAAASWGLPLRAGTCARPRELSRRPSRSRPLLQEPESVHAGEGSRLDCRPLFSVSLAGLQVPVPVPVFLTGLPGEGEK